MPVTVPVDCGFLTKSASCGGSFALTSPERPPGVVTPAISADSDPLVVRPRSAITPAVSDDSDLLVVSGSAVLTPPLAPGDTLLLLVPGTLIPGRSSELCWVLSVHLASAGLGPCQQLSWLLSRPSCGGLSQSLLLGMAVGLVWAGRAWPSCCSHAWGCRRSCSPCFPDLRSLPSGSVVTVWRVTCWLLW